MYTYDVPLWVLYYRNNYNIEVHRDTRLALLSVQVTERLHDIITRNSAATFKVDICHRTGDWKAYIGIINK